jgi:5-methylcytosine-specific restriction enzyme A
LASGGADEIENVIALCPNHHREAHFGAARHELASAFAAFATPRAQQKFAL